MTNNNNNRKRIYAMGIVGDLITEFKSFGTTGIKLQTKRFASASKGFNIRISKGKTDLILEFLRKKGLEAVDQLDGSIVVDYPDGYQENGPILKTISIVFRKERDSVIRVLAGQKFFHNKGGRGKKNQGVFKINKVATIVQTKTIDIIAKNTELPNQMFGVVANLYEKQIKEELVSVDLEGDYGIKIFFTDAFIENAFPKQKPVEEVVVGLKEISVDTDDQFGSNTTKISQIINDGISANLMMETATSFKKNAGKAFITEVIVNFSDLFTSITEEEGIKLTKFKTGENGKITISELTDSQITDLLIKVAERFQTA